MREIKFRAQQFDHGKHGFQYGSYATDNKNYHAIIKESKSSPDEMHNILINPETLGQFTGLTDKNGVDIYEGDVVKAVSCNHYWLSVISADNGKNGNTNLYAMEFCNNLASCEFEETYTYERQNSTRRNDINNRMEIIGNIHSNPELLEK